VVGVTDYCSYLSQARGLPTVGGYVDPNYEQMLRLRPDLVILMQEHEAVAGFLDKADIAYMTIDNHDIAGVMRSIRSIGAACGARERADSVVRSIETALAREPVSGDRPSVLLCVGRKDMGGGTVSRVVAAGPRTFYHELIDAAGGRNVVEDSAQVYPMFSVEGVMRLAPEVIIDVGPTMSGEDAERARRDWRTLDMIPAVRTGNVHCLVGTHVTIPGPRIPLLMHDLREVIAAAADRYGDTMPQRSHHPGGVDSLGREGGGGAACS